MKYIKKYSGIFLTIIIFCVCLSGCVDAFDRSGYIQGMLDATYKGECEAYAQATNSSIEAIENDYNDFIRHVTDIFLRFSGLTDDDVIPEDLNSQLLEAIKTIYGQVRYTVKEADRSGSVAIDIEPLDIYNSVYSEFFNFNQEFRQRNNNYEFQDYTDEEFIREYLSPPIEILKSHEENLAYREPVTVTVNVAPDDDGRYTISDEDVTSIYNAMIYYSIDNPSSN